MRGQDIAWLTVAAFLIDLGVRLVALVVVPRNRRPTAAMAWLLAIFFIPFVGIILFLLIGSPRLPPARRAKQDEMDVRIGELAARAPVVNLSEDVDPGLVGAMAMNRRLTSMPMLDGNHAALLQGYEKSFAAMAEAVDAARSTVHVEFYIVSQDQTTGPFFEALARAVARGVTVRVLLDHWASSHCAGYKETLASLTRMGADWRLMLPVQPFKGRYQRLDLRNHRKLLVVDGQVAFVGSQNVIDRSYNKKSNLRRGLKWQELMARVEGPVVAEVELVFATDWYMETDDALDPPTLPATRPEGMKCQVVPSGPGYNVENNLQLFLTLLYAARERVVITSPYFVPEESMLRGMMAAVDRGVQVDLFVSLIGDQALVWHAQRSYYEALLVAGVRIFQYPAPFVLHAKHVSVDGSVAVIGSSNMDMRSFGLNAELSLYVQDEVFVGHLNEVEDEYRRVSVELTLEAWREEPLRRTVLDGLARLTSSLQ